MFSRIQVALGLALIVALITVTTAFTKGNFSFITIAGQHEKATIVVTDPKLTDDFFAFANFTQAQTNTPVDPGVSYEVTRYYLDHGREIAFDHFHYYPRADLVYYDGLIGGWSEYDGKWYVANPGIKAAFENTLSRFTWPRQSPHLILFHLMN